MKERKYTVQDILDEHRRMEMEIKSAGYIYDKKFHLPIIIAIVILMVIGIIYLFINS